MRASILALFVAALISACSPTPTPKQPLPASVNKMTMDQLKMLYAECTKYGFASDPRVIYSEQDCGHLVSLINSASLKNTYQGHGVGQPMLH